MPLIVSWPARWKGGQRRTGACSLVDLVQTIAEIGGASVPGDWNGDSLLPLAGRPDAPWKDLAVSRVLRPQHRLGLRHAPHRAIQVRLPHPPDDKHPPQRELYDLKADPGEFHNLAADADQQDRIRELHAALVKELGEDPDKTEQRARAELSRGYPDAGEPEKKPARRKAAKRPPADRRPLLETVADLRKLEVILPNTRKAILRRNIESVVRERLEQSPAVAILGPRQRAVKSTLGRDYADRPRQRSPRSRTSVRP